jgi:hypothetical protein
VAAGATPNATVADGANTIWLMSTVVFQGSSTSSAPTAPGAPTRAAAVARHDRHRWVYEALLKGLSPALLCHHWNGRSLRGLTGLSAAWYAFS